MYYMLVACMAGPLNTGQEIATPLLFHIILIVIYQLFVLVLPEDPMSLCILAKTLVKMATWHLGGHPHGAHPKKQIKCFKKPKKKVISKDQEIQDTTSRFDNFFETTRHGGPDVSGTICLQQIARLDRANAILSEMSAPIQRSVMFMYPETPSEGDVPPEELPFFPPVLDVTSDDYSISEGDSQVSENTEPSRQSRVLLQAEGVTPVEPTVTAGTRQRGRVRTMSQRMAESITQGMHHVARLSTMDETDEDLFHNAHLDLQERMRNHVVFHITRQDDG